MVAQLDDALLSHGQSVAIPPSGTVGGALALGRSGVRRLGYGPVRDAVLQVRYVSAAGEVVKAGGPTVKNVSGFDVCRLLVGSRGTLGFLGDVILRTRPRSRHEQWFSGAVDPVETMTRLYRPTSVLWDGTTTWVLLEGDERDIDAQVAPLALEPAAEPPALPTGGRWSIPPGDLHAARHVRRRGRRGRRPPRRSAAPAVAGPCRRRPPPAHQDRVRPDGPAEPRRRRAGWLSASEAMPGRRAPASGTAMGCGGAAPTVSMAERQRSLPAGERQRAAAMGVGRSPHGGG